MAAFSRARVEMHWGKEEEEEEEEEQRNLGVRGEVNLFGLEEDRGGFKEKEYQSCALLLGWSSEEAVWRQRHFR